MITAGKYLFIWTKQFNWEIEICTIILSWLITRYATEMFQRMAVCITYKLRIDWIITTFSYLLLK